MRAIIYAAKGPSSVMRLVERPVPEPGPGQVRVRLVRAGVNPTDWKARGGGSAPRTLTAGAGNTRLGPGTMTGQVVLAQGGAGAVGNAAIQLAAWSGATVLATVSGDEKAALATAAGAHHVVNYRAEDAAAAIRRLAPDGVDV